MMEAIDGVVVSNINCAKNETNYKQKFFSLGNKRSC